MTALEEKLPSGLHNCWLSCVQSIPESYRDCYFKHRTGWGNRTSPKYPALPPSRDSVAKACKSQELDEPRGFGRFTDKIRIGLYFWPKVIKCSLKYFAWGLGEIVYLCYFSKSENSNIYKAECFLECSPCLHSFLSIFKPSMARTLENFMLVKCWISMYNRTVLHSYAIAEK